MKTQARGAALSNLTLERVFAGSGFADTPASPLQRAICRAAEGRPLDDVLTADECESYFGCAPADLPSVRARRVVLICGVRGGKTLLSCCAAITACLTADLSSLKQRELPRFALIAPTVDLAHAAFEQLVGIIRGSAVLSVMLEGTPTQDTVVIRRPDGFRVEIMVVAAHRGGMSVRGRWLIGALLDEVASFGSETEGKVVNAEELLRAAETRLLPGCQVWLVSSPFGPVGLLYDLHQRSWGKPGATIVVHAPTRALNPSFPQSRIDEIAAEAPDVAAREYDAEWVDPDSAFLAATLVESATRAAPLARPASQGSGRGVVAAMDAATRGNDWTLAIAWPERDTDGRITRVVVAGVWRWQGSKKAPLSTKATLAEIGAQLRAHGIYRVKVDGWSFDALNDQARELGFQLEQNEDRDTPYHSLKGLLSNAMIELPPDPVMRHDLLSIRQRATSGGTKIVLPKTADGRHCDFAPSVALAAHGASRGTWYTAGGYEAAPDPRHQRALHGPLSGRSQHGLIGDDWDDDDVVDRSSSGVGYGSLF